jgi:ABC-type antimicrobial peptide transport system permease subunit
MLLLSVTTELVVAAPSANSVYAVDELLRNLDLNAISNYVSSLSVESRFVGQPGFTDAVKYVEESFREMGVQTPEHFFGSVPPGFFKSIGQEGYLQNVTILTPIDTGSWVEPVEGAFEGHRIKAYPLWPDRVATGNTGTGGVLGPLVYFGFGDLENYHDELAARNGNLSGVIAVLEFNSSDSWLNLVSLGASGVIFLQPNSSDRLESESKMLNTPLDVPRLYVSDEAPLIRQMAKQGIRVRLVSGSEWSDEPSWNVIGVIPGSGDLRDQFIVIGAHIDSWSVVPEFSPGADESLGLATLLQLAKAINSSSIQNRRSVILVAYTGHWSGMIGARWFVETYLFELKQQLGSSFKLTNFVDLNLASDSDVAGYNAQAHGTFFGYNGYGGRYSKFFSEIQYNLVESILSDKFGSDFANSKVLSFDTAAYQVSEPMEGELASVAGMLSSTIYTGRSYRLNQRNMFDTVAQINWKNVATQVEFINALVGYLLNLPAENLGFTSWDLMQPSRFVKKEAGGAGGGGLLNLNVSLGVYDLNQRWYSTQPILSPDLLLVLEVYTNVAAYDPRAMIRMSPKNGSAVIYGLPHFYSTSMYTSNLQIFLAAFGINKTSGILTYAPDLGALGNRGLQFFGFQLNTEDEFRLVSLFRTSPIVLFDVIDPVQLSSPVIDPHTHLSSVMPPISVKLADHASHTDFLSFFMMSSQVTGEKIVIAFPPVDANRSSPVEFIITRTAGESLNVGILTNSSVAFPEGTGFVANYNKQTLIPGTVFQIVKDMLALSSERQARLRAFNVISAIADESLSKGDSDYERSLQLLNNGDLPLAEASVLASWNEMSIGFSNLLSTLKDVALTGVLFSILDLPFAFLAERLFFEAQDPKKRLLIVCGIYSGLLLLLYFLHPGYALASNILVALIAFVVLVMALPVVGIIFNEMTNILKEVRSRMIGLHFSEISRLSAASIAYSNGVLNMRKRRFRTALTMTSIVLVSFSLISLTSSITYQKPLPIEVKSINGTSIYPGLVLRASPETDSLPSELMSFMKAKLPEANAIVLRSFLTPPQGSIFYKDNGYTINGILALMPDESKITSIDKYVEGRWFTSEDRDVCLISEVANQTLRIPIGEKILYLGRNLTVIGVIRDEPKIYDMDGKEITPVISVVEAGSNIIFHISWANTLIVPFRLAEDLNSPAYTVSVQDDSANEVVSVASDLSTWTKGSADIYVESGGSLYRYTLGQGVATVGAQSLLLLLLVGGLTILNTLVGSVTERTNEIRTLGAIGLSPLHVASLFLAETSVYAIFGSVLGYLLGLTGIRIIAPLFGSGFIPNYSSSFVIYAVFVSFASTMISSLYPISLASRLVTPSLERRWRVTTKPVGDSWSVPLPFEIPDREEVDGLLAFMSEYFLSHKTERAPDFSVWSDPVSYEGVDKEGKELLGIRTELSLPPYDARVIEIADLRATFSQSKYGFLMVINRIEGSSVQWGRSNLVLLDLVRKQLLFWRGLTPSQRQRYIDLANEKKGQTNP